LLRERLLSRNRKSKGKGGNRMPDHEVGEPQITIIAKFSKFGER